MRPDEVLQMPAREYMQWGIYFARKAQQMELANRR